MRSAPPSPPLPAGTSMPAGRRWLAWIALLLAPMGISAAELVPVLALVPTIATVNAATTEAPEYNTKAGYLLTFTRYVEWPGESFPTPEAPVIIGVLGTNPFGEVLKKTVQDVKSRGRPVEVRLVATVEEAAKCHVVFIARKQERDEALWLHGLQDKPVLTITESTLNLASGAVLTFLQEKNLRGESKVVFSASLPAARKAGLKLPADLLQFARKVLRDPVKLQGTGKPEGEP